MSNWCAPASPRWAAVVHFSGCTCPFWTIQAGQVAADVPRDFTLDILFVDHRARLALGLEDRHLRAGQRCFRQSVVHLHYTVRGAFCQATSEPDRLLHAAACWTQRSASSRWASVVCIFGCAAAARQLELDRLLTADAVRDPQAWQRWLQNSGSTNQRSTP